MIAAGQCLCSGMTEVVRSKLEIRRNMVVNEDCCQQLPLWLLGVLVMMVQTRVVAGGLGHDGTDTCLGCGSNN